MKTLSFALIILFSTMAMANSDLPTVLTVHYGVETNTQLSGTGIDLTKSGERPVPCVTVFSSVATNRVNLSMNIKTNDKVVSSVGLLGGKTEIVELGKDKYAYRRQYSYAECCHSGGDESYDIIVEKLTVPEGRFKYAITGAHMVIREDILRNNSIESILTEDVQCTFDKKILID